MSVQIMSGQVTCHFILCQFRSRVSSGCMSVYIMSGQGTYQFILCQLRAHVSSGHMSVHMSVQVTCQFRSHKFISCQFRSRQFIDVTSDQVAVRVTCQFTSQLGRTSGSVRTVSLNSLSLTDCRQPAVLPLHQFRHRRP